MPKSYKKVGRPKSDTEKVRITLVIETDELDRIDEFAKQQDRSRAQVIRRGVRLYIEQTEREGFDGSKEPQIPTDRAA